MIGQLTATRALLGIQNALDYLASKLKHSTDSDQAVGTDLNGMAAASDLAAAKTRRTTEEIEHIEAFCLKRDINYGRRSRRFLYTQAYQEKLRSDYELWMIFARENTGYNVKGLAHETDHDRLTNLTMEDFQNGSI